MEISPAIICDNKGEIHFKTKCRSNAKEKKKKKASRNL